ncbi:centrosomal protein of 170 kDa protein B-like isoform X2 [Ptychodera flava]|uniref:centrosomal protein of 170 kDa protein B-like isoform X2 n=1 Tax=Ptychodera flava TaxID=63121 RepID=UPI00396A5CE4
MAWCLVSSKTGLVQQLQQSMMFIGREDCEIMIQSRTVDKRHAVINYDEFDDLYTIKDVGSLNGTFVNETRIPEQKYISMQPGDTIRFGYDPIVYRFEKMERVGLSRPIALYGFDKNEPGLNREGNIQQQSLPLNSPDLAGQMSNLHSEQVKELSEGRSAFKTVQSGRNVKKISKDSDNSDHATSVSHQTVTTARRQDSATPKTSYHEQKQYHRVNTGLKPTEVHRDKPSDDSELTIVTEGQKHASFTIEFKEKEKSPKMDLHRSLSKFIPPQVKERMDEKGRIIEEKKILRKIEEHLDLEPEKDVSGREKFRQKKLNPADLLTVSDVDEETKVAVTMVESEELLNRIFTENSSSSTYNASLSMTSGIMEQPLQSRSEVSSRSPLTRSKSMPSRKTRPVMRRKQPDPEKMKELTETVENSDNASETGTYTIEGEKQSKEEKEARKKIDEIFGIQSTESKDERDNVASYVKEIEENQTQGINAACSTQSSVTSQSVTPAGSKLSAIELSENQHIKSQPSSKESRDGRSSNSPAPFQRTRSMRGKRVLPQTPGSRNSPLVLLRTATPSAQQFQYGSASEREDIPVAGDIVSPPAVTSTKSVANRKLVTDDNVIHIEADKCSPDRETTMTSSDGKVVKKGDESPVEVSFASSFDDYSQRSSEFDIESDLDTASTVSLVDGDPGTSKQNSAQKTDSKIKKSTRHLTPKKTSSSQAQKSEQRMSSDSGIWNRLSRPNRHKVQTKDETVVSENQNNSSKSETRHERRASYGASSSQSTIRKSRTSPSIEPRMTRTTALRKSRFGDQDSGSESTDISARSEKNQPNTKSKKKPTKAQAFKERLAKSTPRIGNRTKLGDTDWKSETSLGGMILQTQQGNTTSSTQSLNEVGSSQILNLRTCSVDMLQSESRPSAFKPVQKTKDQESSKSKSGGRWRRYDNYDNSVSDSESTVKQTSYKGGRARRSVDSVLGSGTDDMAHAYTGSGRHSAEIARISSTLADDLAKLASSVETEPKGHPADKDGLLFYYVSLLDDMFSEDTPSNSSGQAINTSILPSKTNSKTNKRRENIVSRSTSFTMGLGKSSENSSDGKKHSYEKQNGQKRPQWHSQTFDSLVLSSIYQLSLKLNRSSYRLAAKMNYIYESESTDLSTSLESDIPVLKTATTELAEILGNLRKVEKRLDGIEKCVDPDNRIEVPAKISGEILQYKEMQGQLHQYRKQPEVRRSSWQMGVGNSGENVHDDWADKSEEEYY